MTGGSLRVLGVETSCDETSAAVLEGDEDGYAVPASMNDELGLVLKALG